MTRIRTLILTATALGFLIATAPAAQAHDDRYYGGNPYYYNYNPGNHHGWDNRYDDRRHNTYYWNADLSPRERDEIGRRLNDAYWAKCRTYAGRSYYGTCNIYEPVRYEIGRPLPARAVNWTLPRDIAMRLPRLNPDLQYVWIGRDILVVSRWDGVVRGRLITLG